MSAMAYENKNQEQIKYSLIVKFCNIELKISIIAIVRLMV